jgi:hypothetical protein
MGTRNPEIGVIMEVETASGGLCGLDQYCFPVVKDGQPCTRHIEYTRLEIAFLKALFSVEGKPEYQNLDFSSFLNCHMWQSFMIRGEYLLSLFSGVLASKTNGARRFVYVVIQTETKPGVRFVPKLFARSLPVLHSKPGIWMNSADPWDFIDTSLITPVTVLSTS